MVFDQRIHDIRPSVAPRGYSWIQMFTHLDLVFIQAWSYAFEYGTTCRRAGKSIAPEDGSFFNCLELQDFLPENSSNSNRTVPRERQKVFSKLQTVCVNLLQKRSLINQRLDVWQGIKDFGSCRLCVRIWTERCYVSDVDLQGSLCRGLS